MKLSRVLLALAALLLFATAAFHASGGAMVSSWLDGDRGAILRLLWYVPTIDWAVIGLLWLFVAWRGDARSAPLVWISAIVPLAVAIMLARAVGPGFPGIWMLTGAVLLAVAGSFRLRRRA
jgi:hypothetical protein